MIAAAVTKPGDKCAVCTDGDADFIITRANGSEIKLQVWKSLVFADKNRRRENIYIAFRAGKSVYCYPHNEVLQEVLRKEKIVGSRSWQLLGHYFIPVRRRKSGLYLPEWAHDLLAPYRFS